jgi:hypothetical protein
MSQDTNIIITCGHTDCLYNHEKECGKEILYANDNECKAESEEK